MDIVEILSADYVFNTDDKYDLEGTLDAPTLRGGEIIVCDGVMYVANQGLGCRGCDLYSKIDCWNKPFYCGKCTLKRVIK